MDMIGSGRRGDDRKGKGRGGKWEGRGRVREGKDRRMGRERERGILKYVCSGGCNFHFHGTCYCLV